MIRRGRAAALVGSGLLLLAAPLSGQVGLAGGFGTTGLAGEVAVGLGERFVLRAGAGISTLDVTTTFDGIPVELDLPGESYMGGLDYFLNSAFRVGLGVMVRPAKVGVVAVPDGDRVNLGGRSLSPDEVGFLTGLIESRKQAPYAVLGFGRHVAPGVGLALDVGAAYFGTPTTTLQATGGTLPSADLAPLLAAEVADFDNEMKTYLKVWPILRLAVRVGLGERPVES